jgi:membrane-bound lytic murein transglycosylase D
MRYFLFLFLFFLPNRSSFFDKTEERMMLDESDVQVILQREPNEVFFKEAQPAISDELTAKILTDFQNRVPEEFEISPYFHPFVKFWFGIYTRYSSEQIVIHDKNNLGVVYSVLDFTHLGASKINRFAKANISKAIINEKVKEIKAALIDLSIGNTENKLSISILKTLIDAGEHPPVSAIDRQKFFLNKAEEIRSQTGQRNLIGSGIDRMIPFSAFLKNLFLEFNLPIQLLSIPFVESSFNNSAHSKVGAQGIWQFMPLISSYFMPKRSEIIDYRLNPLIASVAALHLLKENKMILKSWDLAVTAYNSGTKHLVKARKELKINSLEEIFLQYETPHIGFASKNFYAEFLAIAHTLAYKDEIFQAQTIPPILSPESLSIGLLKCPINGLSLMKNLGDKSDEFFDLNPHLLKPTSRYPAGTIVVTNNSLIDSIVRKLSLSEMKLVRPKQWQLKYLKRRYNCSTR